MKSLPVCAVLAAAALSTMTGCKTQAERFGYKGEDLADPEARTFVVTAPAVTNWVPERVLTVIEKYDLSAEERRLVETVGVLMPGASYEAIPDSYKKDGEEPWFVWWAKPSESLGLKNGRAGVLSHFNEDKKVWETNESYFSTYWKTKEEAQAALAVLRAELERNHGVKMFHPLDNGWIAEYVRLCVMGVVGQKADGSWSCMLDFRDKCNVGCGPWEPVPDQQERLVQYRHAKAVREWKVKLAAALAQNRELVEKAAAEKGLAGLPGATPFGTAENGQTILAIGGAGEPQKTDEAMDEAFKALWSARVEELEKGLGVTAVQAEPVKQEVPNQGFYWSQFFQGPLYQARLEAVKPLVPAEAQKTGGEAEETASETPAVAPQWRILFTETLQPGIVLPQKPQLKK